jgi:tripartite-type tricarboxylate transporter receptor subunit TctC
VPTFEEAGAKGIVLDPWQGAFAPPRTPSNIVALLNAEMGKALADSTVRARLLEVAQEVVGGSAEQFARLVRDDSERYARLARESRIAWGECEKFIFSVRRIPLCLGSQHQR